MFGIERLQAIRELVKEKKVIEVTYLSKALGVSEVTIRRDLDKLEKEGLVTKTYGGAVLIERPSDHPVSQVYGDADEADSRIYTTIAKTAAKLIESGDTLFIAGSAMGEALVRQLIHKDHLIVVTNNLDIALYLHQETEHKVVILGGALDSSTGNVMDLEQLKDLLIEKSFISAEGVDQQYGYTVHEKSDVRLYQQLKSVSRHVIGVIPGDSYDKRGLVRMATLDAIDIIVSDKGMPDYFKAFYYEHNIKVHTSMLEG